MLANYLKMALKVLARRKFFTFVSLFGIAVTLLVLLVATALLDHVFAPQPPETRADRTLGIYGMAMSGPNFSRTSFAGYRFLDGYVRDLDEMPQVEEVSFLSAPSTVISYVDGRKIESSLKRTDGAFWRILDFEYLEGGPFTEEDAEAGRFLAVINETTRRRFFGGEPAVGRTIRADGQSFRVVGVVHDVPALRVVPFADVWVPIRTAKSSRYQEEWVGEFLAILLARSRADFPAIKEEVAARFERAEAHLPDPERWTDLRGGADTLFEAASRMIFGDKLEDARPARLWAVLLTLMALFLILPTVNLVNLNLSRILERSSEIGVRKAFGASSWTLVGQFVVENVVLTLIGAGVGLVLAAAALSAINASGLIPYADLSLNLRVFLYALALAVFFGLLSGVYPAWRMSRFHPVSALHGRPR